MVIEDAIIKLHDISREVALEFHSDEMARNIRKCADELSEQVKVLKVEARNCLQLKK
jgi:hypothetical protein